MSNFSFFQSKNTYPWQVDGTLSMLRVKQDFIKALENSYEPILQDEKYDFYLSTPLRKNLHLPMKQPLAIYAIIYYLGSLVRYNPSYIEKLLNSKDAWIIERFAKSAPETFLRYISNAILQKKLHLFKKIVLVYRRISLADVEYAYFALGHFLRREAGSF